MKKRILACLTLTISTFCATPLLRADDVTDSVEEAMDFYKAGNFTEAAASLEYAAQLVRQKRSGDLAAFLPSAPKGWEIEDEENQAISGALLGGVTGVTRNYRKKGGDASASVAILTDSPMLQSIAYMINNPAIVAASGMKAVRINGVRGMYDGDDEAGQLQLLVDGRFLITLEGDGVGEAFLTELAGQIPFADLK